MKQVNFSICLLIVLILFSCIGNKSTDKDIEKSTETKDTSPEFIENESTPDVGETIYGDFDGNGTFEYALVKSMGIEEIVIAPEDTVWLENYAIYFLDDGAIIPIGCCDPILIAEGDLDGDGSCDISIFQAPMNGCTYQWRTISYKDKIVRDILEPFLIATGCDADLTYGDLQDMVVLESGSVYLKEQNLKDAEMYEKKEILPIK